MKIKIAGFIFIGFFATSCCGGWGDPVPTAAEGISIFFVKSQFHRNSVFGDYGTAGYPRDSLKVYNEKREPQLFHFAYNSKNEIILHVYDEDVDQASLSREVCKTYLFQFLYKEIDTLKVCYQTQYTKCEGTQFANMNAIYNNKIVYSEGYAAYRQMTIEK